MLLEGRSYIVEINIMSAIVASEPLALIPLSNAGVVEMEAELFDRGALPVPESVAFRGSEASQLLVALEAVRTENENSSRHVLFVNFNEIVRKCYLVSVVFPQYCQGSSADSPATE